MKKNSKLIILGILFSFVTLITTSDFTNPQNIYADAACNPYDCAPTNAYLKVNSCTPSSGYNCLNSQPVVPSQSYNCTTGGGPGSCTGPTPGVETCGGNVYQFGTTGIYDCVGDPLFFCNVDGASCGNYGTCQYTPGGPGGTCNASSPGGPGVYAPGCPAGACPPRDGTRGCCLITSTPTPTPAEWCGDGTCQGSNGETCSSCETDCGVCTPPPGEYCGDDICNNGETQCSCARDGCTNDPCPQPSCDLSLSPSSASIAVTDSGYTLTANPSNVQNGNISLVEFVANNSNITVSPQFDSTSGYTSQVTPNQQGSATITATAYMGDNTPRCSSIANVTITAPPTNVDEAPDCESFSVTTPNVSEGGIANFVAEITDIGENLADDGSFESGGMSYWPTAHQLNEWWAVPAGPNEGNEGAYFAKISPLLSATDAHAATDWIEAGENLTNKEYSLKLIAKSHSSSESINRIYLQREPYNGYWASTADISNVLLNTNPSTWTTWQNDVTWPDPGNGSNTSRFRVVLRPGSTHGGAWAQPIYYDAIKAYKTSTAGVNASTVNFYYIPASSDPCGSGWQSIGTGTRMGSSDFFEIDWDTTGVAAQDYIIAVNANDIQNNRMTGNPGNCGTPGFTFRAACNGTQTITACSVSCTEDCGTGVTLGEQPSQVTPAATITDESGGRKDLTSSDQVAINWTPASITSPATIDGYQVYITERGNPAPGNGVVSCSDGSCELIEETNGPSDTQTTYIPQPEQTDQVDIYVRAFNNDCPPTVYGPWSPVKNIDYVAEVSGIIYDTPSTGVPINNCTGGGGSPVDISGANPLISNSLNTNTVIPTSSYTLTNIPYAPTNSWFDHGFNVTLDLSNPPDPANTFFCNCPTDGNPQNCRQTDTASPPATGTEDFYVTAIDLSNGPWWQTSEGNVYGAAGYNSPVPNSCVAPICNANLITQNAAGDNQSAGAPMSGGTVNANGYYTEYDGGTTQPVANNTSHNNLVREDYNLFIRNIDLSTVQPITATVDNFNALPAGTNYEDAEVYYSASSRTFDFSTNQGLVTGGEKKVFFVNGDITIIGDENNLSLQVDQGSYAGFIASGNIIFEDSVGNTFSYGSPGSTAPNIDGVFVASGVLRIADDGNDAAPDNMFVGTGTYVGWGGVELNRSFDNTGNILDRALNNEYPTNLFEFRPDFNENTPEILRRPNLVWQEVN